MKSRKTTIATGLAAVAALIAAIAAGVVHAQMDRGPGPGPGIAPPPMIQGPPRADMKAGVEGVYILRGPTILKYNTGLQEPSTLVLIEPGKPRSDGEAGGPPPPIGPIEMLITPAGSGAEKVLVVAGDQFFSIDGATLKIVARATLPAVELPERAGEGPVPGGPGPGPGFGPRPMGPPPATIDLQGDTLYVMRANQIAAIRITDGKIVAQTNLPGPPEGEPREK